MKINSDYTILNKKHNNAAGFKGNVNVNLPHYLACYNDELARRIRLELPQDDVAVSGTVIDEVNNRCKVLFDILMKRGGHSITEAEDVNGFKDLEDLIAKARTKLKVDSKRIQS